MKGGAFYLTNHVSKKAEKMYNYFMLVGRISKEPDVVSFPDGKKVVNVSVAVSRSFRNTKGEIETDFFTVAFWDFLVDFVIDTVKVGMPVGIKGRIQNSVRTLSNSFQMTVPSLIGERIIFFGEGSNKTAEEEKNEE